MDKVYTYLMIISIMSFLLWASGNGGAGNMFDLVYSIATGGDVQLTAMWVTIALIFTGITAAVAYQSVIAGNASAAIAGGGITMSLFLISFVSDIVAVLTKASSACDYTAGGLCGITYWLIAFICVPLAIGFMWSIGQLVFGGGD